jgi:16S rRNA (guanine(966)-N(2))-methyltransferase RsmD
METRPTADRVKESLFNMLADRIADACFLDVFAGNGSVGIEALSRGAKKCVFIEKNKYCVKIIKENLLLTCLEEKGDVIQAEAGRALALMKDNERYFDIIFLDPPYFSPDITQVLKKIEEGRLLSLTGSLVVEHHCQDTAWLYDAWLVVKEKKYGDTCLAFIVSAEYARSVFTP